MDKLDILTVREGPLSKIVMNAKKIGAVLTQINGTERKEIPLSVPIDTTFEYAREKNINWTNKIPAEPTSDFKSLEPEWVQNISITASTPAKVVLDENHFRTIDGLTLRHLPKLRSILTELMANADTEASKEGRAATVVVDEDVVEQARGYKARAMSPAEVKLLLIELENSKRDLKQAVDVQNDLGQKTVNIQLENIEMAKKCEDVDKKIKGYEKALNEMQSRLGELQKRVTEKEKPIQ